MFIVDRSCECGSWLSAIDELVREEMPYGFRCYVRSLLFGIADLLAPLASENFAEVERILTEKQSDVLPFP
jgi:hypothetical protein